MNSKEQLNALLSDPGVKFAHKNAALALDKMDCVDAFHVARALLELQELRLQEAGVCLCGCNAGFPRPLE